MLFGLFSHSFYSSTDFLQCRRLYERETAKSTERISKVSGFQDVIMKIALFCSFPSSCIFNSSPSHRNYAGDVFLRH